MPVELVLTGNGPGELSGWIAPVAWAARREIPDLRLTLALTPSQFVGGRELEVVRGWNLFDRILDPRTCLRAAAGLVPVPVRDQAAVVHLGGDLWLSGRLALRLRRPACALAETTLVARRHRMFSRIFTVSPEVTAQLAARGVPAEKIMTTGDPRVDAMNGPMRVPDAVMASSTSPIVSFLPGSRSRLFRTLAPYFLRLAAALRFHADAVRFRLIVSPYLPLDIWTRIREESTHRWPELDVEWVTDEPWPALASSDLVVTIPGTNTLELALLAVPFAVVVETDLLALASLEGVLEWVTRVPGLGAPVRRALLLRHLSRLKFTALPNLRAGREIVPEWVGRWAPEELAKQVAALLRAPARREAMRRALRDTFDQHPGASRAIVGSALALARGDTNTS